MTKKIRIKKGKILENNKLPNVKPDEELKEILTNRLTEDFAKFTGLIAKELAEKQNNPDTLLRNINDLKKERSFDAKRKEVNDDLKAYVEELAFIYYNYINILSGAIYYCFCIETIKTKNKPKNNEFNNIIDELIREKESIIRDFKIKDENPDAIKGLKNSIPDGSKSQRDTNKKDKDTSREEIGLGSVLTVITSKIPEMNKSVEKVVLDSERIHEILKPAFEVDKLPYKTKILVEDAKRIFEKIKSYSVWIKKLNESKNKN